MGRPSKSLAEHVVEGTFRARREAHRALLAGCSGTDEWAMNAWLTTAKLVPVLGLIPLGAAVTATFIQRDPTRVRVAGQDTRRDRRSRR